MDKHETRDSDTYTSIPERRSHPRPQSIADSESAYSLNIHDDTEKPENNYAFDSNDSGPPQYRRTNSDIEGARPSMRTRPSIFSSLNNFMHLNSLKDSGSAGTSGRQGRPKAHSRISQNPIVAPVRDILYRRERSSVITNNVEELNIRRKFLIKLARALLSYGAPSHRIESQLSAASEILGAQAEFVHLPNIIIVSLKTGELSASTTYFVRATGKIALTKLHDVHLIYRDVLHDKIGAEAGTNALRTILRAPPIYPLYLRCCFSFFQGAIICVVSFGGSILDMWVSGACAATLQYLGLNAANKSSMYANVYEISVSIIVAFTARGLSNIPGNWFCYSAISSAGVVVILPGFTVLVSSLELMSRNIFCGSVRIVYAIIYTLFLGFGLTIGSDFYLVVDRRARKTYYHTSIATNLTYLHGQFSMVNGSAPFVPISGVLGQGVPTFEQRHVFKGCFRDPNWKWYLLPFPWWTLLFLVPLYSLCSSLSNLQAIRSRQLPVMVTFSCCSFAANRAASIAIPGRTDLVSASGAFVIGLLGNVYSRLIGGTAFTSMVTGVLFLVPSAIAQGGGLTQTYTSSAAQYSTGFSLALRMISVAAGVTIGLFVSQVIVYLFGRKKNAAHFAF